MTFLATIAVFAGTLAVIWVCNHRRGGRHECSCSRSRSVLADYERRHSSSASCPNRPTLISTDMIARN